MIEQLLKVSVIIPVYNVEQYLRECLDSVINQTLKEIEIICVDDGSTDSSLRILEEYKKKDSRITIFSQQNLGAAPARNLGIEHALGEYLYFADADDYLDITALEKAYFTGIARQADAVIFGAGRYDMKSNQITPLYSNVKLQNLPEVFSRDDFPESILQITNPAPWTKLFRREFILDSGLSFVPLQNSNDLTFTLSAIALAERITSVNESLYFYRIGMTNNTQSNKEKNPTCFITAIMELWNNLERFDLSEKLRKTADQVFFDTLVFSINTSYSKETLLQIYRRLTADDVNDSGILNHEYEYYADFANSESVFHFLKGPVHFASSQERNLQVVRKNILKSKPIVSVVIPVYNKEKYLRKCIESIQNQSLQQIEIICVDDGSTDGSFGIMQELASQDPRIMVIRQNNSGLSAARNSGAGFASGKYLYYIDSDDMLKNNALEMLSNRMEQERLDVLFFAGEPIFETEELFEKYPVFSGRYSYQIEYPCASGRIILEKLIRNNEYNMSACMQIARKDFLDEIDIEFYDAILHEDNLYTFKVLSSAFRAAVLSDRLYTRRVVENSIMTSTISFYTVVSYAVVYYEIMDYMQNDGFTENQRRLISEYLGYSYAKIIMQNYSLLPDVEKQWIPYYLNPSQRAFYDCFMTAKDICLEMTASERRGRVDSIMLKCANAYYCLKENGVIYTTKKILSKIKGIA